MADLGRFNSTHTGHRRAAEASATVCEISDALRQVHGERKETIEGGGTLSKQPGFIAVIFDVPFPTSVPNGSYISFDPVKTIAVVTLTLREGSRAFFRNRPLVGPTSFQELHQAWQEPQRPRADYSYVAVNQLHDGRKKTTLNIHAGTSGGYAECKYYTEVTITYLADDIDDINRD